MHLKKHTQNTPYLTLLIVVFSLISTMSARGQSPLAWYTLNGDSTDQGSIEADGSLVGNAEYTGEGPGVYSQSLSTPSAGNNYLTASTGSSLNNLDQVTISLWLNLQGGTSSSGDRLLSTLNQQINGGFDLRFSNSATADNFKVFFSVNSTDTAASNTVSSTSANGISADNQWVFLAVTYDGSQSTNNVHFYLGNETESLVSNGIVSLKKGTIGNGSDLRIGATPAISDRTPPAYFSDVRIYDQILDMNELEVIRASVTPIPEPAHFVAIFGIIALAIMCIRKRIR